jgi:hypothetical protein
MGARGAVQLLEGQGDPSERDHRQRGGPVGGQHRWMDTVVKVKKV